MPKKILNLTKESFLKEVKDIIRNNFSTGKLVPLSDVIYLLQEEGIQATKIQICTALFDITVSGFLELSSIDSAVSGAALVIKLKKNKYY